MRDMAETANELRKTNNRAYPAIKTNYDVLGREIDRSIAENNRLRAALSEIIEIAVCDVSTCNFSSGQMILAIRKCAVDALSK